MPLTGCDRATACANARRRPVSPTQRFGAAARRAHPLGENPHAGATVDDAPHAMCAHRSGMDRRRCFAMHGRLFVILRNPIGRERPQRHRIRVVLAARRITCETFLFGWPGCCMRHVTRWPNVTRLV
ncbi:hypothetical protein [Burkholderia stagnalis]|uniref:hypothetical protein n=1 Tax=Burkholderia stagnalis TaxID=1503054 RepID=UPI000F8108AE|nr:hypothetical protein [Burkholderia stagnalis]